MMPYTTRLYSHMPARVLDDHDGPQTVGLHLVKVNVGSGGEETLEDFKNGCFGEIPEG